MIIALLLLAGAAGLWHNLQQGRGMQQKYAVIYVNNRPVKELSLSGGDRYRYSFFFGAEDRHQATLEVDGGRVRMLPLPEELCPKGICAHTGWIAHGYESIVCLPNRIMVVFSGVSRHDGDIDGITY